MGMRSHVTDKERDKIIRLRRKGLTYNQISALTGRCVATVAEISQEVLAPRANWYKGVRKDLYMWLCRNWRWKPPAEQRNNSIVVRRKRRKPTNFRTPYSYPRLWDEERKSR